ncbi:MAG: prepilin peptidase [Pedosphaera sp.]|nr:prepilin peptidase [Pedosphaera sp.]
MGSTFDSNLWATVPFHFWSMVLFALGSMVGSFLNVCIHRLPRGESVISPPSHCPHCEYRIPWFLNVPIFTWIWVRGRCKNCKNPISIRYLLVEVLTGLLFLGTWLRYGNIYWQVAIVMSVVLAGLVAATFIDYEHYIIPDEITLGGIGAGFLATVVVPAIQHTSDRAGAMRISFYGILVGGGIVYGMLRLGKLLFGRQRFAFPPNSPLIFGETGITLPDQVVLYEEIFYRASDRITVRAKTVELPDICYWNKDVSLTVSELRIGDLILQPSEVPQMIVTTDELIIPREAMGLGDVKFMAAIGAFLGPAATVLCLMLSAVFGSLVAVSTVLLGKREWSAKVQYGPYIALAAVVWVFIPLSWQATWTLYLYEAMFIVLPKTWGQ